MRGLSLVLVCMLGCDVAEPSDAGVRDAGAPRDAGANDDAGSSDAGSTDAGLDDAGAPDAGSPDAGLDDAGTPDAGNEVLRPQFLLVGAGNTITVFRFNTLDGGLTSLGTTQSGAGSSFLAADSTHRRLYAVNEGSSQVAAFTFERDGGLQLLNRVASGGSGPAHLSVDRTGQFLLVANYTSGSVAVVPVTDGGVAAVSQRLDAGAQAHQLFTDASNRFAYAPCKGSNHVAQFAFANGALTPLTPPTLVTASGAGPRHLALHPTLPRAYLINELSSTVQTLAVDASGTLSSLQTMSTLPSGFSGNNTGAEIAVHPNGRFVFGSNRGHDSLARFAVDATTGALTLLGHTPTGGQTPRHFSIDASGRFLAVGNQGSGSVSLFAIDAVTGALSALGSVTTQASPAFAGFVDAP